MRNYFKLLGYEIEKAWYRLKKKTKKHKKDKYDNKIKKIKEKINICKYKNINNNTSNFCESKVNNHDMYVWDILKKSFRDLHPINMINLPNKACNNKFRLNVVTDSIQSTSFFGGVGTGLLLATQFACKHNMELRIITRHSAQEPTNYYNFMKMLNEPVPEKVSFWTDYDRDEMGNTNFRLEMNKKELFMATSWWTAKAIKNSGINNFYYIVQEIESFFYPYGDSHLLCSEILEDKNIKFIINFQSLYDYLEKYHNNVTKNGVVFDPAFPQSIYSADFENIKSRKNKKMNMFFYGRPHNSRNLYFRGLEVLDKAVLQGIINLDEWDIYFVGNSEPIIFSNGYKPKIQKYMSWEKYSEFIKTIDLGFSLMYTPHPSYPPLDIISSGGVAVTNKFEFKNSCDWSKNLILENLDIDSLLKGIEKGIILAKDIKQREKNYIESNIPNSWKKSFEKAINFMEEYL